MSFINKIKKEGESKREITKLVVVTYPFLSISIRGYEDEHETWGTNAKTH